MEPVAVDALVAYKNFLYGEYDIAKAAGSSKLPSITFHLATLEESIAEELLKASKPMEAVIHLVSQGSLLVEIDHKEEARTVFEKAKTLTDSDKVKKWIDEALCQLK